MERPLRDKPPGGAAAGMVGKDSAKKCAGCDGLGMRTMMRKRGPWIERFQAVCLDCNGESLREKPRKRSRNRPSKGELPGPAGAEEELSDSDGGVSLSPKDQSASETKKGKWPRSEIFESARTQRVQTPTRPMFEGEQPMMGKPDPSADPYIFFDRDLIQRRLTRSGCLDDDDDSDDAERPSPKRSKGEDRTSVLNQYPPSPFPHPRRASTFGDYEHLPLVTERTGPIRQLLRTVQSNHVEIRLLDLAPSSDPNSRIRCSIRHVYLDEKPSYKALSYVWGDDKETLPISIDGRVYQVTVNCHVALQPLRLPEEAVTLWIDSICINQCDVYEKSFQIVLMTDIYSFAEEVYVWLGRSERERDITDEPEEVAAIILIKDLAKSREIFDDPDEFIKVCTGGDAVDSRWNALGNLFQHKWFERLWVQQEIVVAKRVKVLGLTYCIPWEYLAVAALAIEHHVKIWDNLSDSPENLTWNRGLKRRIVEVGHMNVIRRCWPQWFYDREARQVRGVSLLQLLQNTRHYKCMNPLDKCFAIFGLVGAEGLDSFMLQTNYGLSVGELYAFASWYIIKDTKDLEVLCLAGLGNHSAEVDPKVPSWVVDWREDGTKQPNRLDYSIYNAAPCEPVKKSMEMLSVNLFKVNLDMALTGRSIDTITIVLKEDGGDFWQAAGLRAWHWSHRRYPATREKYIPEELWVPQRDCPPEEAWIRTVTADLGTVDGKERRLENKQIEQISTLLHIGNLSCEDIEKVFPKGDTDYDSWETQILQVGADFIRTASRATDSRAFFITSKGFMGIGPLVMQEDDIVCVFPGCNVPLLVRENNASVTENPIIPEDRDGEVVEWDNPDILGDSDSEDEDDDMEHKKYLLVGECFVWGLMNGEQKSGAVGEGEAYSNVYESFVFN
jgi:hypothetical protein